MKVEIQRKHAVFVERDGFGHLIPRHSLPLHSLGLASRILRETFGPWRPLVAKRQRVAGCFIAALTCYEKPRRLKSSAAILRAAVLHTSQRCASLPSVPPASQALYLASMFLRVLETLLAVPPQSKDAFMPGARHAGVEVLNESSEVYGLKGFMHFEVTGRLVFRYLQHALHVERVSLDPL